MDQSAARSYTAAGAGATANTLAFARSEPGAESGTRAYAGPNPSTTAARDPRRGCGSAIVSLRDRRMIEVRGFKWPRRPTGVAVAQLLGEDQWGHWLGVRGGAPWWTADRSHYGVFERPLVKLVPSNTFWTACFHPVDPVVDVDIVLPVCWSADVLEEVDLELDVLRAVDGRVWVRDQHEFDQVRKAWSMPDVIAAQAEATCQQVRTLVEQCAEPFGTLGRTWLSRFIAEVC